MQDLKYSPDENTPEELAKNYKEDGNFNFKCKKYRFAIASYTEGLKAKSTDLLINTQLLTNRAVSQFHIGNYRSSLLDCQMALRFTPDHMKAILRGASCQSKMKHHAECRAWCDRGLELDPGHEELLRMRGEAVTSLSNITGANTAASQARRRMGADNVRTVADTAAGAAEPSR